MILEIKNRLNDLSYDVTIQDNFLIEYLYLKISGETFTAIGNTRGNKELDAFVVDRVCGLFLQQRYLEGKLGEFSENDAVTQIQEGDLSISFREAENKLEKLCEYLINKDFDLSPYRSVIW